jgi:hypothetical protein
VFSELGKESLAVALAVAHVLGLDVLVGMTIAPEGTSSDSLQVCEGDNWSCRPAQIDMIVCAAVNFGFSCLALALAARTCAACWPACAGAADSELELKRNETILQLLLQLLQLLYLHGAHHLNRPSA